MTRPLAATSIGPIAARLCRRGGRGQVLAVFRAVVWIALPDGAFCLARAGTEPGPLTLTTAEASDWRRLGLRVGQPVAVSARAITLAGCRLDPARAAPWHPARAAPASPDLTGLRAALPDLTAEGLGGFLTTGYVPGPGNFAAFAAAGHIGAARVWCGGAATGMGWAPQLIGLGPGLTPSGDDFLGGLMIGLIAQGRADRARRLWRHLAAVARRGTNPMSYALLSAAAEGLGSASLHAAIAALQDGTDPAPALEGIARIGHSSGWDALAGAVTALEATQHETA